MFGIAYEEKLTCALYDELVCSSVMKLFTGKAMVYHCVR